MDLEEVIETYKQATGQWAGCDWRHLFEGVGPNLKGVTSSEAEKAASELSGEESERWERATAWLTQVEQAARVAEQEAQLAYRLVVAGHPGSALPHAHRACDIESRYHETLIWGPLLRAVEALVDRAGFVCETHASEDQRSQENVILPWSML